MAVCDGHGALHGTEKQMTPGEGYLLAGRFVQSSVIQEKLLDQQMPMMRAYGISREQGRLQIESRQGAGPWLICEDCIGVLGLSESDRNLAREAAKRWWRDNSLPGYLPGQGEQTRNRAPAFFLIYGNGFKPSEEYAKILMAAWLDARKQVLGSDATVGVRAELREFPRVAVPEFLRKPMAEAQSLFPTQVVDSFYAMQEAGRDAALIAVWPPEDTDFIRGLLERLDKSEAAGKRQSVGKESGGPAEAVAAELTASPHKTARPRSGESESSATASERQQPPSVGGETSSRDYQRVRRACEASKEAALVAARAALTPQDQAAGQAAGVCKEVWNEALSDLGGKRLDLSGADFSDMAFAWCEEPGLCKASFRGAKLDRTIWFFVNVKNVDFSDASLRQCKAWGFFCDGASFKRADLSGGALFIGPLSDTGTPVDFSDANLTGAILSFMGGEQIICTNAKMDGCQFLFAPGTTRQERKMLLASLSDKQRQVIKTKKKWWEFWK